MQLTPLDIILGSELSVRLQLTTTLFDHADVVIIDDGASHDQLVCTVGGGRGAGGRSEWDGPIMIRVCGGHPLCGGGGGGGGRRRRPRPRM